MSSPMIKVTDARYVYANGAVLALDGVSLEIPEARRSALSARTAPVRPRSLNS